ncbi:MAG: SwmB domain-containing protein, partial [Rhodococcus sp.]|nr:SwmB domain-containing protein [Rhodococcus sp. (in: high G+C Gram-positive bacteria)]
ADDVGKWILVKVSFTDGAGNSESRDSDWTAPVVADATLPTISSATLSQFGGRIDFEFSEAIDTSVSNRPLVTAFAVTVNDVARTVSSVELDNQDNIYIVVTPIILQGETVVLTYTDPTTGNDAKALQDAAGNDVETFTITVTNNSTATNNPATGGPTITGRAEVNQTLTANRGTINDPNGLPATFPDDYSFQWRRFDLGTSVASDISGATSSTYRPVADDVGKWILVKVSFTDGAGNSESRDSDWTAPVVADTPPTLESVTVAVSGGAISLVFSEAVQASNLPAVSTFTVTADGNTHTVTAINRDADRQDTMLLSISPNIFRNETVVIAYTDPSSSNDTNALQDTAGNDVATFTTGRNTVPAVTNNSGVTRPALDLAADGEVTAGAGDRYFFTRDDFKFRESGGRVFRSVHINSLPDKGWLWLNGFLKPHHLPATIRADSLDQEAIVYIAPEGSGDDFARFTFDVSAYRGLKSESNYTMTVNVAPRGEELVVDGDNVLVSTLGQQTYPVAHEVDATRSVAQPLSTGMNGPARDLGGIVVQIAEPSTATPDFDLYTAVAGGSHGLPEPGAKITDLEGSVSTAGLQTFTPASAVELAAGTTYFVVFRTTGGSVKLASTASKHDDSGTKPGLTIDKYARAGPWGEWTRPTTRVRTRMAVLDEVVGHSVEADPPTVQGTPVLSGAGDDGTWS